MGRFTLAIAVLAWALTGCTDEIVVDPFPAEDASISLYRVTGTNGAVATASTPGSLDANQNSGRFRIDWNGDASPPPYNVRFAISRDTTFDNADLQLASRNCDQAFGDCQDGSGTLTCTYTSSTTFQCSSGGPTDTVDGSTYFTNAPGLPGNYHLVMYLCNGLFTACETASRSVTIQ